MKNFNVIGLSRVWLGISSVLIIASIACIAIFGLNFGIDFTGGSLIEMQFGDEVTSDVIISDFQALGYEVTPQESDKGIWLVRLQTITSEEHTTILGQLSDNHESFEELRFESIGPVIGQELKRKSVGAVILLLLLIMFYVAWAFRKVSKPVSSWKYGLLTIVAALHDVIIPVGVFSVLGHFYGYQIDTAFIAAMLTILGYSINDTIVVFDRTRENLVTNRHSDVSFDEIVNKSVIQSFGRSINTSVTTMLVLLAIFLFGALTIKPFVLALIIGIISGAYSSIFIASPLLVYWQKRIK
ncbi:protein translocase subunit SecF [Patescibacteria group bacterium]|nr:protein translocase subunit SecF [Patescibacteria group bacterium]